MSDVLESFLNTYTRSNAYFRHTRYLSLWQATLDIPAILREATEQEGNNILLVIQSDRETIRRMYGIFERMYKAFTPQIAESLRVGLSQVWQEKKENMVRLIYETGLSFLLGPWARDRGLLEGEGNESIVPLFYTQSKVPPYKLEARAVPRQTKGVVVEEVPIKRNNTTAMRTPQSAPGIPLKVRSFIPGVTQSPQQAPVVPVPPPVIIPGKPVENKSFVPVSNPVRAIPRPAAPAAPARIAAPPPPQRPQQPVPKPQAFMGMGIRNVSKRPVIQEAPQKGTQYRDLNTLLQAFGGK